MTGHVAQYQALLTVPLVLDNEREISLEFVVDTGFEGAMTLPRAAVEALNLPFFTQLTANLADDSGVPVAVHVASIRWQDKVTRVAVLAMGKRPLLGTALLAEHRIEAHFTDGGHLSILPL